VIIAQNKLATTTFIKKESILISEYKGRVNIDLALSHLQEVKEFHLKHNVKAAIVDIKNLYGSFAKVYGYIDDSFPEIIASGLKYSAYVLSEDLIIANLGEKLKETAAAYKLESEVFSFQEAAIQWAKESLKLRD